MTQGAVACGFGPVLLGVRVLCLACVFTGLAGSVQAETPETSLRPLLRPSPVVSDAGAVVFRGTAVLRPQMRPAPVGSGGALAAALPPAVQAPTAPDTPQNPKAEDQATDRYQDGITLATGAGVVASQRPLLRPDRVGQLAKQQAKSQAKGRLCGVTGLQGEAIGRVSARTSGCGVASAVRVRNVSGIALSAPAVMNCETAKALKTWVDRGMNPAFGGRGGGVRTIEIVGHYACRTRNNLPGAKISEHGKGRAIDIAGFTLRDGRKVTLLKDWGKGANGRSLRAMHKAACGPFGTVLGPEANKYHRDHFHFDTARYRSGSYCR